jgi:hypothetical protein
VFPEASESYSGHFDHKKEVVNLPFESYKALEPVRIDSNGRKIILNGNRLAFLEPMEATAVGFYLDVARMTFDWVMDDFLHLSKKQELMSLATMNDVKFNINKHMHEIHTFILWHYTKGSVYDTPFWRAAQAETTTIFKQPNEEFEQFIDLAKSLDYTDCRSYENTDKGYGQWPLWSIKQWYDEYINN